MLIAPDDLNKLPTFPAKLSKRTHERPVEFLPILELDAVDAAYNTAVIFVPAAYKKCLVLPFHNERVYKNRWETSTPHAQPQPFKSCFRESATWRKLNVPYFVAVAVYINNGTITLEPGVSLVFGSDASVNV